MAQSQTIHSFPRQLLFRFVFIFFLLFIIVNNNGAFLLAGIINYHLNPFWESLASWTAIHVFHQRYTISSISNGSGDTPFHYLLLFIFLVIALVGAIIWQFLDRKRTDFSQLDYWLSVAVRYYLGLMLINYGIVKLFDMQFGKLTLGRLSETYGESSPMGLAWTFLAFSHGYNVFMGTAELLGVLLLFRRTYVLGACIALMTTFHVMMINYCYDVPVKITSTALVVMAFFLLIKNAGPLLKFFFTRQAVSLTVMAAPEIENKWLLGAKIILKTALLLSPVFSLYMLFNYMGAAPWDAPKPKLYGLYTIQSATIADTSKAKTSEVQLWRQMIIGTINLQTGLYRAMVNFTNDSAIVWEMDIDSIPAQISMSSLKDTNYTCNFNYQLPDSNHLLLNGYVRNDSVTILLEKHASDVKDFRLMKRGFHWINEQPYNR
jgi:hypothetical protein